MNDIYFDHNYGKLYEKNEQGESVIFKYKTQYGEIINQFIKRKISPMIDSVQYYDIVTPYGYGGPCIIESINRESLVKDYGVKFSNYCLENNIVTEFVRFHPLINNAKDTQEIYHPIYNRHTLGTNLKDYDDPVQSEFSKTCRQNIRKKLAMGMRYKVTVNPTSFESFKKCYYSTMDRNNAAKSYYFNDEYFAMIHQYFGKNTILVEVILNNKTIAAGLYFVYDKFIHIHLSGTLKEYLHLSPAYILRYGVTIWGKENGYQMIHHGGGRTSSEDDSLYLFKKQFAKNTKFDFYVGKKIWNQEIYDRLCEITKTQKDEDFFPAYRKLI